MLSVAVLGGGVAGLATAISLSQIGMTVNVYERRRTVHNLGAGVVCWPNASFILNEFGLLDQVRACAGLVTRMQRISREGAKLGTLDLRQLELDLGFASYSILRDDLLRILLQRTAESCVPIHFNRQAIEIEDLHDCCRVQFAKGGSIQADLVIGADGRMNSIAREYITGSNEPVFQEFVNWIGISRGVTFDEIEILDYWGVGARFGIVPVSQDTAYWAGGVATPLRGPDGNGDPNAMLRRVFTGWPSPVGETLSTAVTAGIRQVRLFDHNPTPTWHRGRVLMIGDAAHAALPTSGQGVGQALEDAWWLAHELESSSLSPEIAMDRFTHRRAKKTTEIILTGRALAASLFNVDPAACKQRDLVATQTDYESMASGMATAWGAGLPIGK